MAPSTLGMCSDMFKDIGPIKDHKIKRWTPCLKGFSLHPFWNFHIRELRHHLGFIEGPTAFHTDATEMFPHLDERLKDVTTF